MREIDDAFISCLNRHAYIRGKSVALVGELNRLNTKETLAYKLKHVLKVKHVDIFTRLHPFTIDDGERYDLILGVRPCAATILMLDSAIKYKKRAYIVLCQCGGYKNKLLEYLPKCTSCDFIAQVNSEYGWPVLIV